jgi:hypothetical protein
MKDFFENIPMTNGPLTMKEKGKKRKKRKEKEKGLKH